MLDASILDTLYLMKHVDYDECGAAAIADTAALAVKFVVYVAVVKFVVCVATVKCVVLVMNVADNVAEVSSRFVAYFAAATNVASRYADAANAAAYSVAVKNVVDRFAGVANDAAYFAVAMHVANSVAEVANVAVYSVPARNVQAR